MNYFMANRTCYKCQFKTKLADRFRLVVLSKDKIRFMELPGYAVKK